MKFLMRFDMDNAAFEDAPELEAVRILEDVATRIRQGAAGGNVRDVNGNTVGKFAILGEAKSKRAETRDFAAFLDGLLNDRP